MIDFEIQRASRRCSVSGRELAEGEEFYSLVKFEGAEVVRLDFAAENWQGAPPEAVAWWKSRVPHRDAKKPKLAPSEAMLELFRSLENEPAQLDTRYVLALLLIRRRVLRLEETERGDDGQETLVLYCSQDESTHRVVAAMPSAEREEEIQRDLAALLFASAS